MMYLKDINVMRKAYTNLGWENHHPFHIDMPILSAGIFHTVFADRLQQSNDLSKINVAEISCNDCVEICDTYLNMLHSSSASFYSLYVF